MNYLKQKSKHDIDAAKFLIDNKHYTSSVHCAYYSCLQILKVICIKRGKIIIKNKPVHKQIIDYICAEIKDDKDRRSFRNTIYDLKLFREKSDYEDVLISEKDADKAYNTAKKILRFIYQKFEL
jgi:uncharacterized protein (UPF0332 family)